MYTKLFSRAITLACALFTATCAQPQTWTPLINQPPAGINLCLLLTDASVFCQANFLFNLAPWYRLIPDSSGSYQNGTWSAVASMPSGYVPLAFGSAVLADGRVAVIGGEYNNGSFALTNMGAIYDPVADAWTMLPPPPGSHFQCIGDPPSTVLSDGRLIVGSKLFQDLAVLDPSTLIWAVVNSAGKTDGINSEEGWTLLPDGSIFTLDVKNAPAAERFLFSGPATGSWAAAANTPQDLHTQSEFGAITAPGCPVYHPPGEIGPTLLRPDGTVFAIGANGLTAIYTPPAAGSANTGTWAQGPSFPGLNVEDGPAADLPNGHVLFGASPGAADPGLQYYEFDGQNLISVPAPKNAANDATTSTSLLVLPTGQVMFVDGTAAVELYTPAANPAYDPAWAPATISVPERIQAGTTYSISGTQFNGLDQGSAFGDENQNASNYPLVRITNSSTGRVFYARTHDHSTMGVATGSAIVSTYFDVPAAIDAGDASLQVVANGIASAPVAVTVTLAAGGSAPTVVTGTASAITVYSVTLGGSVKPGGANTKVWFEYSADSSLYGSLLTPQQDIAAGAALQTFGADISGLAGTTTYYYRAWASNGAGTGHGAIHTFTQSSGPNGYTNFGPNNSFATAFLCIAGQLNTDCGDGAMRRVAAPFTPDATLNLRSISAALSYAGGANTMLISLCEDAGGIPGTSLESWTVSNLSSLPPVITTVNDQLGLTLLAGHEYWVEVQPVTEGGDTLVQWYLTSLGKNGVASDPGSGWQIMNDGRQPAFEVAGVPLAPFVNPGGVVSASAFGELTSVAPGSWVEIYGSNLAASSRQWQGSDFSGVNAPVDLDGTSVTIAGQPAFVSFISAGQVNVQVPSDVPSGMQMLIVTTRAGGAGNPYSVMISDEAPGLLAPASFLVGGKQYVAALFPDYLSYVVPTGAIAGIASRSAHAGDTIILYGTGFGEVIPSIAAGQLVDQTNALAAAFHVSIGSEEATVTYAGLAPRYVGLYQFNVVVPQVPAGDLVPLGFTLSGKPGTQTLYLAVQ